MPWWFMASWEHRPCGTIYEKRQNPPMDCDFCARLLIRVTKFTERGWRKVGEGVQGARVVPNPKIRKKRGHRNVSPGLRKRVYDRDGWRCVECGSDNKALLTVDHRIPWSRGGRTTYENLQTMCKPCNQAKGDEHPEGSD